MSWWLSSLRYQLRIHNILKIRKSKQKNGFMSRLLLWKRQLPHWVNWIKRQTEPEMIRCSKSDKNVYSEFCYVLCLYVCHCMTTQSVCKLDATWYTCFPSPRQWKFCLCFDEQRQIWELHSLLCDKYICILMPIWGVVMLTDMSEQLKYMWKNHFYCFRPFKW